MDYLTRLALRRAANARNAHTLAAAARHATRNQATFEEIEEALADTPVKNLRGRLRLGDTEIIATPGQPRVKEGTSW